MRYRACLIVALFVATTRGYADSGATIKSGWNVSSFTKEFHGKLGVIWGVEKEWTLKGICGISLELAFASRGGGLKDKVIGSYRDYVYDFNAYTQICSVGFLDLPLLLHFYWPKTQTIHWHFYFGPSLSLGVHDNSERWETRSIYYNPSDVNAQRPKIDYHWNEDAEMETLSNSTFSTHIGCGAKWRHYHFEMRYSRPWTGFESVKGVWMGNKKYHTLNFIIGVWLPKK